MCKLFEPNIWINQYLFVELSDDEIIEIKNKIEDSRPGRFFKNLIE